MIQAVNFRSKNVDVFSEFKNYSANTSVAKQPISQDSIEFSKSAHSKSKNKKSIIIGLSLVAATGLAVLLGKKAIKNFSSFKQALVNRSESSSKRVEDVKKALTTNIETPNKSFSSAICFYGPNSKAKEKSIADFVLDLSNSGFEIKQVPRAGEATTDTIASKIVSFVDEAKELFNSQKRRTAIVVRDLDKLAPELPTQPTAVNRVLKVNGEHTLQKGFLFIFEALNLKNVDSAVRRPGRMDSKVIVAPFKNEAMSLQKEYISLLTQNGKIIK